MQVPERKEHWDAVYTAKPEARLSWYEREPAVSLKLIEQTRAGHADPVVDVGGGTSSLVDELVRRSYTDVTVLDVSEQALDVVRRRLGTRARGVTLLRQDVLTWTPARRYTVWHDRALFHFLVDPADRDAYVELASGAVEPSGSLVLATFATGGPEQCSGLPVARYDAADLAGLFGPSFTPVTDEREEHVTPGGVTQPFTWVVLQRRGPGSGIDA